VVLVCSVAWGSVVVTALWYWYIVGNEVSQC
jgi:hypothetical protein